MSEYCMHCMEPIPEGGTCPRCITVQPHASAPHQLNPGTILKIRYLVGDVIGQGGFGITYIGRDLVLDVRIAIKEYYPTGYANRNTGASNEVTSNPGTSGDYYAHGRERFLEEARALAKFRKEPGVVDVMDYFEANGTAYIVMEFLPGRTLLEILSEEGQLDADWVFTAFGPVMDALEHMHADGLVHRDVSPDNVMLTDDGTLHLMDFGAARAIDPNAPKTMSIMLKVGYTPEEQYRSTSKQGPFTDIYALCATMYKCITRITPASAVERLDSDPTLWPSDLGIAISPEQEAALKRGMQPRPEDRFQSIAEMKEALKPKPDVEAEHAATNAVTQPVPSVTVAVPEADQAYLTAREFEYASASLEDTPAPEQARFCSCGFQLTPGDSFCGSCGKPVSGMVEAKAPAPAVIQQPAAAANRNRASQQPKEPKKKRGAAPFIALAAVLLLAVAAFGLANSGVLDTDSAPASTESASNSESSAQADSNDGIEKAAYPVDPQDALEDYSWAELSQISALISGADDDETALAIAKDFNLVDDNGEIDPAQTKAVSYNGADCDVRIIGLRHDAKTNGGIAGITFQFVDCVGVRTMNSVQSNEGGWRKSDMRAWLNGDFFTQLPSDLQDAIVTVDKQTNNAGTTTEEEDAAAVNTTSDAIWLLSFCEAFGESESDVRTQEGQVYQLFREAHVTREGPNRIHLKHYDGTMRSWWLRTPNERSTSGSTFFDVYSKADDPDIGGFNKTPANREQGVAPCFCI